MAKNCLWPKEKTFKFEKFYNCSSDHVVYCLGYPWNLLYIGQTIHPLRERFGEHRRWVEEVKDKHSTPWHFAKSSVGLEVWVIEQILRNLSEAETFWIYSLDTLSPGGLNEELKVSTIL